MIGSRDFKLTGAPPLLSVSIGERSGSLGDVRSSLLSRACDLLVRRLSALLLSRTEPHNRFPEKVRQILAGVERIELYALDPEDHQNEPSPGGFHGYRIIGQVTVQDAGERFRIGRTLAEGNDRAGRGFLCFDPSVGVSAVRSGQRVDLLICFWCGNAAVIGAGAETRIYPFAGWPGRPLRRQFQAAGIRWVEAQG